MAGFRQLLREIHERSLWQVAGSYLLGAWVAIQATDTAASVLGLPDGFVRLTTILLLAGLPLALLVALLLSERRARAFESTPAGGPWTRRRLMRSASYAALSLLALLLTAATGYVSSRALGIGPAGTLRARGLLTPADRVVLADFSSSTGDSLLARVIATALRVDLGESGRIALVEEGTVRQAVERMGRDPTALVTAETAVEIAQREGLKAVIAGEVNSLGPSFVFTARVMEASTGAALLSVREAAADSMAVLAAVDRLSRKLRERVGEPLASIAASPPLEAVTTSSLQALRKFTQARHSLYSEGDQEKGIALAEEALSLDPEFASAHQLLGMALIYQPGQRERGVKALTNAFRRRSRVTERERYLIEATYHDEVRHSPEAAITAYRRLLDAYPNAQPVSALNNLGVLYEQLRDYEGSLEFYQRALRQDSLNFVLYLNVVAAQVALGRDRAADSTLRLMRSRLPANPGTLLVAACLASATGRYDAALTELRTLSESQAASSYWRALSLEQQWKLALLEGRLGEAEALLPGLQDARTMAGDPLAQLNTAIERAWLDVWVRGRRGAGLAPLQAAIHKTPLSGYSASQRPYLTIAMLYALAGRPDRARELVNEYEAAADVETRREAAPTLHLVLAQIALAENRARDAIVESRRADQGACRICALPTLGMAYEAAAQQDSAIAVYERYVRTPGLFRVPEADAHWLPFVHERLGMIYESRADNVRASRHYARILELWRNADLVLRPKMHELSLRLSHMARGEHP